MPETRVLLRNHLGADFTQLAEHLAHGGFKAWKTALEMGKDALVNEVKAVNLRGRGGAGFPAGVKWSFLPKDGRTRYLVINADEGEPGTFKDRYFLEEDPFRLLEGCLLTSWALDIHTCYVYIRGEFHDGIAITEDAIAQMHKAGWLGKDIQGSGFDLEIYIHPGAGAYVCGEETALIESIEGKPGLPRLKPPFPANVGLFGMPTVVNNVETIACVPVILELGKEAFNALGTPGNEAKGVRAQGGTKLVGISGHVKKPGVYEVQLGVTVRHLIYDLADGILDDRELLACIPGGSSTPLLMPEHLDLPFDFDSLREAGTMLGTAGIIVMHDGTDVLEVMSRLSHFYKHESCGQCTPCRQGTGWLFQIIEKMRTGQGTVAQIDVLYNAAQQIEGNTICALGDAAAWPIKSFIERFRPRIEASIRERAAARAA